MPTKKEPAFVQELRKHGLIYDQDVLDALKARTPVHSWNALLQGQAVARKDALRVFGLLEEHTKTHWCLNEIAIPLLLEEARNE